VALFLAGAHSASAQKSTLGGLIKPPVIDKHDIRFSRLIVNGETLQSRIYEMVQDDYGFLWFRTSDGLYKFDGYSLKPYRHQRGNPNTVSDDTIQAVYKDRDGNLWIGTKFGGLDRLDVRRNRFTHYRHEPGKPGSLANDNVICVYRDRHGQLWIGTSGGLDLLESASGTFVHHRYDPRDVNSLCNNLVTSLYEDHVGNLWIGTSQGLNKLERATGRFSRFLHDPSNPHSIGNDYCGFYS
jgi:ligand-binding sensor domain-containing protein